MPILDNSQYETFAFAIAEGLPSAQAYVKAGFSAAGARQNANRLLHNLDVSARIWSQLKDQQNADVLGASNKGRVSSWAPTSGSRTRQNHSR